MTTLELGSGPEGPDAREIGDTFKKKKPAAQNGPTKQPP